MLFAIIGNDPRFQWTAVMSRLIVDIDEALASDEPFGHEHLKPFGDEARRLMGIEQGGDNQFRLRYLIAVQKDPAVGLAAGRLRAVLSDMP